MYAYDEDEFPSATGLKFDMTMEGLFARFHWAMQYQAAYSYLSNTDLNVIAIASQSVVCMKDSPDLNKTPQTYDIIDLVLTHFP